MDVQVINNSLRECAAHVGKWRRPLMPITSCYRKSMGGPLTVIRGLLDFLRPEPLPRMA